MQPTAGTVPLSDVPFGNAVALDVALKEFRSKSGAPTGRALKGIARAAVASGEVKSVQVALPEGRREWIVDGATFDAELGALLERATWLTRLRGWWEGRRRSSNAGSAPRARGFKRELLRFLSGSPARLRVAERWFGTPNYGLDLAVGSRFNPKQNRVEILGLLGLLAERKPRSLLEVGTSKGGTLYLFSKVADPAARLVTVDLEQRKPGLLRGFARGDQQVELIQADSAAPETLARIQALFPDGVDFMFLDGDHRYEGIRKDFELYRGLARPGGLIAFHDIVPDNHTRHGVRTGGVAGGVHQLWRELRERYRHQEFIAHPEQDGRGIGVLFVDEAGS